MVEWRKAVLPQGGTLRDAIETLQASGLQIVLVVDEQGRLLGTVTDGDIRRALLRGIGFDGPVVHIMNPKAVTVASRHKRSYASALMHRKKVRQVPVLDEDRRVVGLILRDGQTPDDVDNTWVVLMAGGLGTRLGSLTRSMPKPLVPVGGRPVIETIIESLAGAGFTKIFLSVNYKAEMIQEYFGDGSNFGAQISYLREHKRLGTAGALSLLPETPPGPLLIMNADLLTRVDFRGLISFHSENGADATMCVREYSFEVPYGVAVLNDHRLLSLSEKPKQTMFINAGIYVLSPACLQYVPRGTAFDMPQLFERLIAERRETVVFPIREYWMDIGQLEDLERARGEFHEVFG